MRRIGYSLRSGLGALLALTALQTTSWAATPAGAKALEARLYAPCCYGGTLDIHDSDLARSLRTEIESRLARGEGTDAVQADLVTRYGEKVLAARSDSPIRALGIGAGLAAILAAAGLVVLARRWTRRGPGTAPILADHPTTDLLDERIDAELAQIDR